MTNEHLLSLIFASLVFLCVIGVGVLAALSRIETILLRSEPAGKESK